VSHRPSLLLAIWIADRFTFTTARIIGHFTGNDFYLAGVIIPVSSSFAWLWIFTRVGELIPGGMACELPSNCMRGVFCATALLTENLGRPSTPAGSV